MSVMAALVIGYIFGAKSRGRELDRFVQSVKALCETDEFADVVAAARSQVGASLRELAGIIDGGDSRPEPTGDLVATVRHLVGRE